MWSTILRAVFPPNGDPNWTWRRRMAFAGAAVNLSGIIAATWFPFDLPHASMVMTACQAGFLATMGIYGGLATVDDNLKRKTPTPNETPLSQ